MNTKQRLIVFDFDYTLYNAEKWKELVYRELASLFQVDSTSFNQTATKVYAEIRKAGYFDPKLFAQKLLSEFDNNVSLTDVLSIIYNPELFKKCYYVETFEVLENLSKSSTLAIFSTNHDEFFRAKFAPIKQFFSQHIIVSKDKQKIVHLIGEFIENYEVYVVDDLIQILELVNDQNTKIRTVWVRRDAYSEQISEFKQFSPDFIINNLRELISILK